MYTKHKTKTPQKCSKAIPPQHGAKHRSPQESTIAHLFINFTYSSGTQSSLTYHNSPPSSLVASRLNQVRILTRIKLNFDIILSHMPKVLRQVLPSTFSQQNYVRISGIV